MKILFLVVMFAVPAFAVPTYRINNPAGNNTGINTRDASIVEKTAQDQGVTAEDADYTRRIRRALMSDASLSTYGQNVKVITLNQKVTLKGPVRSPEERDKIHEKAAQVAGRESVINELDVISN